MRLVAFVIALLLATTACGQAVALDAVEPGRFVMVRVDGVEGEVRLVSGEVTTVTRATNGRVEAPVMAPLAVGSVWTMTINGEPATVTFDEVKTARPRAVEADAYIPVASWNPPLPAGRRRTILLLAATLVPMAWLARGRFGYLLLIGGIGLVVLVAWLTAGNPVAVRTADAVGNRWTFYQPLREPVEVAAPWPALPVAASEDRLRELQIWLEWDAARDAGTLRLTAPAGLTTAVIEVGKGSEPTPPWATRLRTIR